MTESVNDHELLRRYVDADSQQAFAALVERHIDLVYSAALRQVGATVTAEEVAQSVFLDLARNAARFGARQPLAPWLYVVTRRTAVDLVRHEARRRVREQAAAEIAAMKTPSASWPAIAASLDEAMETLPAADRAALVLRFFQHLSLREVGVALDVSEDTAQKRVSRALERLRVSFGQRGVAVTSGSLATDLLAHAIEAAPPGLDATISSVATKASATLAFSSTTHALTMTTAQKILVAAVLVGALGTGLYEARVNAKQGAEQQALRERAEKLQGELAALRANRDATARQLALAREQLASARVAGSTAADPAIESALDGWLQNVSKLKQRLEQSPEEKIPELQFATAKDWLDATKDPKLDTDLDMRRALSDLRRAAKQHFATQLSAALKRYLGAHNNESPADAAQLAPFFEGPVDPSLLPRYAVGSMKDFPNLRFNDGNQDTWVLREKEPVDPYYDTAIFLRAKATGVQGLSIFGDEVEAAIKSFKAANNGQKPTAPTQLAPFLHSAIDPAFVQQRIDGKY